MVTCRCDDEMRCPEEYLLSGEYEGMVNMIKRWFSSSTTSDALRTWVEKFMQLKACNGCDGKRLKKESLWFKVDDKDIAELSSLDLNKLLLVYRH